MGRKVIDKSPQELKITMEWMLLVVFCLTETAGAVISTGFTMVIRHEVILWHALQNNFMLDASVGVPRAELVSSSSLG